MKEYDNKEKKLRKWAKDIQVLSNELVPLTITEGKIHRAYTVEEILEACHEIGFNPKEVKGSMVGFVLHWLKKHKN